MRTLFRGLVIAVAGAAGLVLLFAGYVFFMYSSSPHGGDGAEVDVDVPAGSSLRRIARILHGRSVIAQPYLFEAYVRMRRDERRIRAGHHVVRNDLPPDEVMRRLLTGGTEERRMLVREGATIFEVARAAEGARVANAGALLAAARDPALLRELGIEGESAEGYLFPDTYDLAPASDPRAVLGRLHARFTQAWQDVVARHPGALGALATRAGIGEREIVILASMIEKEARAPAERALIAGVFVNRLTQASFRPTRMLQSDPTIVYGCMLRPAIGSCERMQGGHLGREQLDDAANPYNTYRHPGPPPGPICSPGEGALEAALAPAETRFFYFVARGDGTHSFSETLAEHDKAVHPERPERPAPRTKR